MKKRILILDESGIFIRSATGHSKDLCTTEGMTTGGIFSFVKTVMHIAIKYRPDVILSAADSKARQLFRKDKFPAYKENRKKNPIKDQVKDFAFQLESVKAFQKLFCIPRIEVPGFEADDIIASLATQYEADGHEIFILSADKDFVQLLNKSVNLILLGKVDEQGELKVVTPQDDLANVFGIDPSLAQDYQGVSGDSADIHKLTQLTFC